jgi:hypothetical protein
MDSELLLQLRLKTNEAKRKFLTTVLHSIDDTPDKMKLALSDHLNNINTDIESFQVGVDLDDVLILL